MYILNHSNIKDAIKILNKHGSKTIIVTDKNKKTNWYIKRWRHQKINFKRSQFKRFNQRSLQQKTNLCEAKSYRFKKNKKKFL